MAPRSEERGDHRHGRARLWRALLILAMSKTFVAECLHHHQRNPHRSVRRYPKITGRPDDGVFGTDFWHAVEFSRNGRAPTRVSRPIAGQPIHAMPAHTRLSKQICWSQRGKSVPRPGRSRVRLTMGLNESKNRGLPRQTSPQTRRCRRRGAAVSPVRVRRRGCASPCATPASRPPADPTPPAPRPGPRRARC